MSNESKLLELRGRIDAAKRKQATLEGQLITLHEQLKALGCDTVEEAEAKIAELQKRATKLEKEVDEGIKQFEEQYGF